MSAKLMTCMVLASAALVMILLLRRLTRRAAGSEPALLLWLILPIMALLPWLPISWASNLQQLAPLKPLASLAATLVHPGEPGVAGPTSVPSHTAAGSAWLLVWMIGFVAMICRLAWHYFHMHRQCEKPSRAFKNRLAEHLQADDIERVRVHRHGPAVLWAPRCRLLLPADFADRLDAQQRSAILAHELMHLQRADPFWRLLAELGYAALWFHPLAWLALPRFRLDQELACDTRTLRQQGHLRVSYAKALVSGFVPRPLPALTGWIYPNQLKERLIMIKSRPSRTLQRRLGYALVVCILLSSTVLAGSTLPNEATAPLQHSSTNGPVVSVNVTIGGTYWNGRKISELDVQHRSMHLMQTDPQTPVLVTIDDAVTGNPRWSVLKTVLQAGLQDVDARHFNNNTTGHEELNQQGKHLAYRSPRPRYPESAIRNHQEGDVVLNVHVGANGEALGAKAESTTAPPILVKAAIVAALQWQYVPGENKKNAWLKVPVSFRLSLD